MKSPGQDGQGVGERRSQLRGDGDGDSGEGLSAQLGQTSREGVGTRAGWAELAGGRGRTQRGGHPSFRAVEAGTGWGAVPV